MCVLVTWLQKIPGYPVVVAANRDEMYARPARSPFIWPADERGGPILAPRDEQAGGTWWAISASGLFVGITNRAGSPPDPARRSRGLLVSDMARSANLQSAFAAAKGLKTDDYNGFHLLVADASGGFLLVNKGDSNEIRQLEPGMHVLSERSFGAMQPSRDAEIRRLFHELPQDRLSPESIQHALGAHQEDPWMSACIHQRDWPGYGTRSSSLIALPEDGAPGILHNAEGPPCETTFEDLSPLLREFVSLSSGPQRRSGDSLESVRDS